MSDGFETYSGLVGKLLANLQALEFLLRDFLYAKADPPHAALQGTLNDLQVGDDVPVNAFTDWSSLGRLIDRYNRHVKETWPGSVVDRSLVALRDALAHGRVWLPDGESSPPLLLKFEAPEAGRARVAFKQAASGDWLEAELRRVGREIEKVQRSRKSL